jgi:hypothetical protein
MPCSTVILSQVFRYRSVRYRSFRYRQEYFKCNTVLLTRILQVRICQVQFLWQHVLRVQIFLVLYSPSVTDPLYIVLIGTVRLVTVPSGTDILNAVQSLCSQILQIQTVQVQFCLNRSFSMLTTVTVPSGTGTVFEIQKCHQ